MTDTIFIWGMFQRMKKRMCRLLMLAVMLLTGITCFFLNQSRVPETFDDLLRLSDKELETVSIARMNLLCAKGLPGSETIDVDECLKTLSQWAEHVLQKEQQYLPAFYKNRHKYRNSLPLFKGVYLGLAIQQDFKCGYNLALLKSGAMDDRKSTRFFNDSSDIFINGLIQQHKGSCSSLPVLAVALGRLCNYPMHLVACGGHLFVRWDDGVTQQNLEITGEGINSCSDDHYRKWPRAISEKEMQAERLMCNLSHREIFGTFASLRAVCLQEHGRYEEALECEQVAYRFFPDSRVFPLRIKHLEKMIEMKEASL
jgi:hypothetical protein